MNRQTSLQGLWCMKLDKNLLGGRKMKLQLLLTNAKKSLRELAKTAGVSHTTLYQIRNGNRDWHDLSVKNYMGICKALGVKPSTQLRKDISNV